MLLESQAQEKAEDASLFAHTFFEEFSISLEGKEKAAVLLAFYQGVRLQRIGNYTGAQQTWAELGDAESTDFVELKRNFWSLLTAPREGDQRV